MSKKIQVTVPDDIYLWLCDEAKIRGIKVATVITILLGEARKSQRNQENVNAMIDKLRAMTPEQFLKAASSALPKEENSEK